MSRKPSNYWEKRSTNLMLALEKDTQYTINDLIKIYEQATKNINKEIETIFKNYSKNNTLDKSVLKKLLNKKETDTHYKNLLKVINTIEDKDVKNKLLAKYNAPAYSYRISRLQALQDSINIEMRKLADLEQKITEVRYVKTIDEAYNHTIFDIQQGTGVGFNFLQLDTDTVRLMLAEKWIDSQNFSQRIWKNAEKLGNYLKINLTADTMSGKSIQKISRELASYMNVGLYNATTLVRTEVNHFANESEALGYEECDIKKYQFIATLDNRTCQRCGSLDDEIFNLKDRKPGINYPPIHPNDRCTTVAYFDDETLEGLERRARDESGKSVKVPADMNYNEWKAKYIDMTFEEKGAISEYSGSIAYKINEKMRNGTQLSDYEKGLVNNIHNGLNKLPDYTKTTYRQIGFDFQGEKVYNDFINKHKIGEIINYNQFISSSKNYGDYSIEDKLKIELTIAGKTGKDIRGFAGIKEENEILFDYNVDFKVIKKDNNKIWLKEI